jgi:hypothetical protein
LKRTSVIFLAVFALLGVLGFSACGFTSDGAADPAFRTLRYEGGDFDGSKFKECVDEGEKLASNDRFYSYPTTQRQDKWDSENFEKGAKSADYPDMELTARGGVQMFLEVTVPFVLNTSCDEVKVGDKTYPGGVIQAFHEIFGKTRNGYFDPTTDGNSSYGEGWLWLMDTYISTCVEQQLTPKVRALDPEQAWLDDSQRTALNEGLKEGIQDCVNAAMETDLQFYTIGNASVEKVTPDKQFTDLYRERQDAKTRAETADLNKAARVKEAEADAAVAQAQAQVKKAEIEGYGGFDNYVCIYMADQGLNCKQPTIIGGRP